MTQRIVTLLLRLLMTLLLVQAALGGWGGHGIYSAGAQTTLTLNASARFELPETPVTLGRISRLEGADAARLGDIVVLARADSAPAVSVSDVRASLVVAGVNLGRMTLRGSDCRIELPGAPGDVVPKAKSARPRAGPDFQVVDVSGGMTIRTAIAKRLAAMHGVGTDAIQLAFDEKDAPALNSAYTERQVVQVQPAASVSSPRVPLRVCVFVADKLIAEHRLSVDVLLRRDVLVATRDLDRREILDDDDIRTESRWLSPGPARPSRELVVGSQVRSRIKDGQTIEDTDLESPVVVKRGDLVYVQCLSGSIVVQARARALAAGREGETIAFQMEGADDSFQARVAGRGRAVMLAVPTTEFREDAESKESVPPVGARTRRRE